MPPDRILWVAVYYICPTVASVENLGQVDTELCHQPVFLSSSKLVDDSTLLPFKSKRMVSSLFTLTYHTASHSSQT